MATTARDGSGTTIAYATSSFEGDVISFDGPSAERISIDATVMTTTDSMKFIAAKLFDAGELTMEIEHEGSQDWIIDGVAETITLDWSGEGVGHKWAFEAFCTSYSVTAAIGERMTASLTLKLTGPLTIT